MGPQVQQPFSQGLVQGVGWKTAEVGEMPLDTALGSPGSSSQPCADGCRKHHPQELSDKRWPGSDCAAGLPAHR